MLHKLYDRVLAWSKHKNALPILWITSVIDSIFFPIPPLVMLLPMMLARPKDSFSFAFATTAGSIIGGLMAYGLGYFFAESLEPIIISLFAHLGWGASKFDCLRSLYTQYGFIAVLVWGFLPVPYKIITWASGFFAMPLWGFLLASVIGRSLRYFGIGALFYYCGASAKKYIDKHFNTVAIAAAVVIVAAMIFYTGRSHHGFLPQGCF